MVIRKMKKLTQNILCLSVILAIVTGCTGPRKPVTVRLVSTSDIHGRIFDEDCLTGQRREGRKSALMQWEVR